jgi:RsiW-degrading membrane proteinase PrsW (M82 family)
MKASLGRDFARLLWPLVGKLSLTFVLINVATYLSFGLAHRLVRAELGRLPVEAAKQAGMIRRMRSAAWLGVALAVWTTWVGIGLGR